MINILPFKQKPFRCGPASLKMVLRFFGVDKTEEELSDLSEYRALAGTRGENIVKVASKLGFQSEMKDNNEISDLEHLINVEKIPVIVSWFLDDDAHFSVVVKIDNENIYLQDPYIGYLRAMNIETFKRLWFDYEGQYMADKDDLILRRMIIIRKK